MELKQGVVYRRATKKDYPAVVEYIRQNNLNEWECTSQSTGKWLSRLYFYEYLLLKDMFFVAEYRGMIVGALITGGTDRKINILLALLKN